MQIKEKLVYAICIGIYLVGFNILFSWTENSKLFGLILLLASSIIIYYTIIFKNRNYIIDIYKYISIKNISLGLLLIIVDITYNYYNSDEFRYLDYGMLWSGIAIILLNTKIANFLKLTDNMISFLTYFLFCVISIYAFIFLIPRAIFFNRITNLTGNTAAFFLNLFKPTNTYVVINPPDLYNIMINFDGKIVGVGDACSGVAMLTVFIAALIAFYLASNRKIFNKLLKNVFIGIIGFFFINVLRIIILIFINYHYGSEVMYFFHLNLGWILFVVGMGVFWYYEFDEL